MIEERCLGAEDSPKVLLVIDGVAGRAYVQGLSNRPWRVVIVLRVRRGSPVSTMIAATSLSVSYARIAFPALLTCGSSGTPSGAWNLIAPGRAGSGYWAR